MPSTDTDIDDLDAWLQYEQATAAAAGQTMDSEPNQPEPTSDHLAVWQAMLNRTPAL